MSDMPEEFVHAAYRALSRRCKFKGFKFLHFGSYNTERKHHALVANFMHDQTGDEK